MMKCEHCKWWKKWTHLTEAHLAKYPQNKDKGECHKNAPAVAGLSEEGYSCWPETKADDWCGEFEPKQKEKVEAA